MSQEVRENRGINSALPHIFPLPVWCVSRNSWLRILHFWVVVKIHTWEIRYCLRTRLHNVGLIMFDLSTYPTSAWNALIRWLRSTQSVVEWGARAAGVCLRFGIQRRGVCYLIEYGTTLSSSPPPETDDGDAPAKCQHISLALSNLHLQLCWNFPDFAFHPATLAITSAVL